MTEEKCMALDREVCEFLGIKGRIEHESGECDLRTYDYGSPWRMDPPKCTCTPTIVYPAVSTTWDGFALMVDALLAKDVRWSYDSNERLVICKFDIWSAVTHSSPLPMALALAVQKIAKESA